MALVAIVVACGGDVTGVARPRHGDAGAGGAREAGGSGGHAAGGDASSGGVAAGGRGPGGATGGGLVDAGLDAPSTGGAGGAPGPDASDAAIHFDCTDPPPPAGAPLSRTVLRELVTSYCDWVARCFPNYYPGVELCVDGLLCTAPLIDASGLTEEWVDACVASLGPGTACPAAPSPLPCWRTGGAARAGESCHGLACEQGLYCRRVTDETCPVCTPQVPAGGPCTTSAECPFLHHCDEESSTCQPLRRPSEPCTAPGQCGLGRCVEGTCRDLLGEGEICAASTDCGAGLRCEGGTCATAFGLPGSPCDGLTPCAGGVCESGTCVAICVDGEVAPGYCASVLGCSEDERCDPATARCVPRARAGEPCSAFTRDCVPGHYCDVSTGCAPLRPSGAACDAGVQCESTYCQRGICTPKCACDMP